VFSSGGRPLGNKGQEQAVSSHSQPKFLATIGPSFFSFLFFSLFNPTSHTCDCGHAQHTTAMYLT